MAIFGVLGGFLQRPSSGLKRRKKGSKEAKNSKNRVFLAIYRKS
jgi:hypothetical protein